MLFTVYKPARHFLIYYAYMGRKTFPKLKRGSTTWINVEHARKSDLEKIAKDFDLEPNHAHLILTTSSRSRFFESSKYVLLSVVHPILNEAAGTIKGREVDIILTKTKICTIHRGHLLPLSDLFETIKSNKKHHAMRHPATLFAEVLHTLALDSYHVLDHVSEHIDHIEKRILSNDKKLVPEFVRVQTNLIDIQKQFENQVFLLDRLYRSFSVTAQKHAATHFEELEKHQAEIEDLESKKEDLEKNQKTLRAELEELRGKLQDSGMMPQNCSDLSSVVILHHPKVI